MGNERGRFEAWAHNRGMYVDRFDIGSHIQVGLRGRYKDRFTDVACPALGIGFPVSQ